MKAEIHASRGDITRLSRRSLEIEMGIEPELSIISRRGDAWAGVDSMPKIDGKFDIYIYIMQRFGWGNSRRCRMFDRPFSSTVERREKNRRGSRRKFNSFDVESDECVYISFFIFPSVRW